MVYGAVVRSPHAHARIVSIDTSGAEKAQGVLAVVTAADFPEDDPTRMVNMGEGPVPLAYARGNILAAGKVLYKGHAVAAVAALTSADAAEAAKKIRVVYEALPSVATTQEAMAEGAPILHEHQNEEDEKDGANHGV
jgi:CO/xanthine dehydrogenase Mo-binding subunit